MELISSMNRVVDYIEENLTEEIRISDLARIAVCTEWYLQRMFSSLRIFPYLSISAEGG